MWLPIHLVYKFHKNKFNGEAIVDKKSKLEINLTYSINVVNLIYSITKPKHSIFKYLYQNFLSVFYLLQLYKHFTCSLPRTVLLA